MKTDIEIARETKLNKIEDIAEKLGVPRDEVQNYGRYIAKVPIHLIDKKEMDKHNLILVSAITPNKAGVGKTTVSIGLSLGLNKIGKKAVVALREPLIVLKVQKQLYVLTDLNAVLLQDKNALNQMVAIAMFAD